MIHIRIMLSCIICGILLWGCTDMPAKNEQEAEIAAVTESIETSIKWCLPDKDRDKLYKYLAHDSSFFMFQPDSRATIYSFDDFQEYAERIFFDPRFTAISSDIKDLRVNLSASGTVAWFSCLLDDMGEWDGRPIQWLNCRWTGVLEKRDGVWLLVQQHFSFPTDAGEEKSSG